MPTLRELREYKAMTQRELAEVAGISKTTVVNIERKKAPPMMSVRKKIAEALGIAPSEINWPTANGKTTGTTP